MANRIRFTIRSDSTAVWQNVNPVLSLYEAAYDTTVRRLKFGDGIHKWTELPYMKPDVIDNLTSTSIDDALSANMGKYLKALHDALRADHEDLKAAHNKLRSDFDALKADYTIVKADHYDLKNNHNALKADHDTLKANHNALKSAHDTLKSDHDALKAVVKTKASQADLDALSDVVDKKASKSDLQKHINSTTDPHPNWKPSLSFSDISGNLSASRVSGKLTNANIDTGNVNGLKAFVENLIPEAEMPNLSFSDISGTLPASRVSGDLTNANIDASRVKNLSIPASSVTNLTSYIQNTNIDASKVNNLTQFVQNLLPDDSGGGGSGDGITEESLQENGYIKFANGLIFRWGVLTGEANLPSSSGGSGNIVFRFPTPFPSACFLVISQSVELQAYNKEMFRIAVPYGGTYERASYLAIGM